MALSDKTIAEINSYVDGLVKSAGGHFQFWRTVLNTTQKNAIYNAFKTHQHSILDAAEDDVEESRTRIDSETP